LKERATLDMTACTSARTTGATNGPEKWMSKGEHPSSLHVGRGADRYRVEIATDQLHPDRGTRFDIGQVPAANRGGGSRSSTNRQGQESPSFKALGNQLNQAGAESAEGQRGHHRPRGCQIARGRHEGRCSRVRRPRPPRQRGSHAGTGRGGQAGRGGAIQFGQHVLDRCHPGQRLVLETPTVGDRSHQAVTDIHGTAAHAGDDLVLLQVGTTHSHQDHVLLGKHLGKHTDHLHLEPLRLGTAKNREPVTGHARLKLIGTKNLRRGQRLDQGNEDDQAEKEISSHGP